MWLQGYVDDLISYVKKKKDSWSRRDERDANFGASLAVDVVKTLSGGDCPKEACEGKPHGEPEWLRLKWGIAIAARALDVCSARVNTYCGDMVSQRRR